MAIPSELQDIAFAEVLHRYGLVKDPEWSLKQAYEEVTAELLQLTEIDRSSTTWPARTGKVMPPA